jgi:hypothetical protein
MYKKKILLPILLVLSLSITVQGQEFAPVGTAVAQFLEIGIGARATAMGQAYTAVTNDAAATFWNPAGLVYAPEKNLFLAYNRWVADISIGGFSFAYNMGNAGTIAVSGVFIMTDDMEVTTVFQPEGTGEMFSLTNYSVGVSYARLLTNRLSVGVTIKGVREAYYNHGYTTWALDVGTVYRTGFHGLNLGMSILHFAPEVKYNFAYIDYSDPKSVDANVARPFKEHSLPINFRVGVGFDVMDNETSKLTTAIDLIHPNNNLEYYNMGLEYGYRDMFFFRGGYRLNIDEGGLSFGAGVRYNLINLDYSFVDRGIVSDIHRLSAGFTF